MTSQERKQQGKVSWARGNVAWLFLPPERCLVVPAILISPGCFHHPTMPIDGSHQTRHQARLRDLTSIRATCQAEAKLALGVATAQATITTKNTEPSTSFAGDLVYVNLKREQHQVTPSRCMWASTDYGMKDHLRLSSVILRFPHGNFYLPVHGCTFLREAVAHICGVLGACLPGIYAKLLEC